MESLLYGAGITLDIPFCFERLSFAGYHLWYDPLRAATGANHWTIDLPKGNLHKNDHGDKNRPGKRPQTVWGSGRIMYDNIGDDGGDDDEEDDNVADDDVEDG